MDTTVKRINGCDIYIILWCLYQLKGVLYPVGIINGLVHYAMLIWGLVVVVKSIANFQKLNFFLKTALALLLMYIVYWLVYNYSDVQYYFYNGELLSKRAYLLTSIDSIFPIFVFFSFASIGMVDKERISKYVLLLLAVTTIQYLDTYFLYTANMSAARSGVTMNYAYNFVSLFPLLFFVRNSFNRYTYALIIVFFVLMGVKRGAILISAICLLFFIYRDAFKNKKRNRIVTIMLGLVILAGTAFFTVRMVSTNAFFMERYEYTMEGESSGRDHIAEIIWYNAIKNASHLQLIFGYGADATVDFAGNFAHNDWLETMCNNGIFGVIMLLLFFIQALRLTKKLKPMEDRMFYNVAVMLLLISFMKSLFSMSIQNLHIAQCMMWGYLCYLSNDVQQIGKFQN